MNFKPFEYEIDNFKEIHINIEDVHAILLADRGIDKIGCEQKKDFQPLHFHSYYEIFYVTDGNLEIKFELNSIDLKKDNLIIIPPKTAHSSMLKSENSSRYCINFFIEKNSLKTEHLLFERIVRILSDGYIHLDNGLSAYESIKKIVESIVYDNYFKIAFYFHQFILNIMEITGNLGPLSHKELLSDSSVSRTDKIQRIISLYYMEDISLESIAKSLHLSTRQLNRIVQNFYGCTYREIITRTRIKAAAELLHITNMTISEISVKVGYHSLRGFYSAFKKYYGCLPSEYRNLKKHKNG